MVQLGELLIAHGASIDAADNMGKTPVLNACESEDHKLVHALCQARCNVNVHDYNGDSPIKVCGWVGGCLCGVCVCGFCV